MEADNRCSIFVNVPHFWPHERSLTTSSIVVLESTIFSVGDWCTAPVDWALVVKLTSSCRALEVEAQGTTELKIADVKMGNTLWSSDMAILNILALQGTDLTQCRSTLRG